MVVELLVDSREFAPPAYYAGSGLALVRTNGHRASEAAGPVNDAVSDAPGPAGQLMDSALIDHGNQIFCTCWTIW